MKVVLVHGQNHKGSSYHVGHMIVDKLSDVSSVDEFFLPRDLNHFCLGCYQCIEDDTKCPFYEEKRKIMDAVEAADLLVFTTPTYCMRASAPMKSLLDLTFNYWMIHKPRKCMFRKKAVVVTTAAGAGGKSAMKDITNTFLYWGIPYVKTCGMSVQAMNWAGVSEKNKAKLEKATDRLARQISAKKVVRPGLKTKGLFLMMRMMQKAGWGSGEAEKEYWETQGWLEKGRPWK